MAHSKEGFGDTLNARAQFERHIVEIKDATPDGWVEFWLSCGHGGRVLVGYPDGHLLMRPQKKMTCWTCRRVAIPKAHHRAKLNAEKVREIRKRHQAGESQNRLATVFGVTQGTISQIVNGDTWRGI